MQKIPKEPFMLVSFLNTQIRDHYGTLQALCRELELDQEEICRYLKEADFEYDEKNARFL